MPYRHRKHSTPKPASKKFNRRFMVEIGHPHYSEVKVYHVEAKDEWEAVQKALAKPGAKKCGYREPHIDSYDRDCEATKFDVSVVDKDTGYA